MGKMNRTIPAWWGKHFFLARFSSITINLGPTFLSGALAANTDETYREPSCPIIQANIANFQIKITTIAV
jgi:hypothetical protein